MQAEPSYDPTLRAKLRGVLQRESVIFKDVILSSGKPSHYYIDGRMTSLSAEGAYLTARLWLPLLRDVQSVGGLTMGADPFIGAILYACQQEGIPMVGFIVRKEAKGHGMQKQVEGPVKPGSRVVIVEDVVTSGASAWKAIEAVQAMGCTVARVLCLVDREDGAVEFFRGKGVSYLPVCRKSDFNLSKPK